VRCATRDATCALAYVVQWLRAMVALIAQTALDSVSSDAPLPVVALFADDTHVDSDLSRALVGLVVHRVADATALERLLATTQIDALVSSWRDGLAEIALRLRVRLMVVAPTLPDALVDAVGRGLDARWIDELGRLGDELRRLGRGVRPADGVRHRLSDVRVRWPGGQRDAVLADLSNDGIAFEVSEADIEELLPGREIEGLALVRRSLVCLSGVRARVRHVEALGTPGVYRIGCALMLDAPSPPAPTRRVRDRAQSAALVKAALKNGIVIASLDGADGGGELLLAGGRIDAGAGTLEAVCDASFAPHELVRGHFEIGGRLYRFTTVVTARKPLTLKLPAVLEETQQRGSARYRAQHNEALTVELRSPLVPGDGAVCKTMIDLSARGFCIAIDGTRDLYPLGLHVDVTLRLPDGPLAASGQVRTLVRDGARLRCGVELCGLDEAAQLRLANFVMRLRYPYVDDGSDVTVDELLAFFRATGFLYPAKEELLAPVMDEVRATFAAAYARPSDVFKAVVARDDDDNSLVGHVSGIRAYRHTWMPTHLAALPTAHVGHLLNLGAADYFLQTADFEFFKIYFHADSKWPARIFGGFAKMQHDHNQSELRAYRHIMLDTEAPLPEAPRGIDVLEASSVDLAAVERYFVQRERGLLLRSDDLTRQTLQLGELGKSFAALGLYRRRRVLVAMRRNVCLGFALVEISSPGLNLSEALSAFQIFVTDEGRAEEAAVRRALVNGVIPIYRNAGRAAARGFVTPDEVAIYERLGLPVNDELWMCWTYHRNVCPRFCDYVDRVFEVLRKRQQRG
jgi:PilZ domain-containing protein